jgi:hypothetical protein
VAAARVARELVEQHAGEQAEGGGAGAVASGGSGAAELGWHG